MGGRGALGVRAAAGCCPVAGGSPFVLPPPVLGGSSPPWCQGMGNVGEQGGLWLLPHVPRVPPSASLPPTLGAKAHPNGRMVSPAPGLNGLQPRLAESGGLGVKTP